LRGKQNPRFCFVYFNLIYVTFIYFTFLCCISVAEIAINVAEILFSVAEIAVSAAIIPINVALIAVSQKPVLLPPRIKCTNNLKNTPLLIPPKNEKVSGFLRLFLKKFLYFYSIINIVPDGNYSCEKRI